MEGGSSLFNPGFLGGSFLWWVGQIADDLTWRKNKNPGKFTSPSNIPGWGERYKVRIIGLHDQGENEIPSEQLPWAQIMYPVTAGGGQSNSHQTSNLRHGMMVFGFFMDGQDQQVPVIMGVLGNNARTQLSEKFNVDTVTNKKPGILGTSGYAKSERPNDDGVEATVPDEGIAVDPKINKFVESSGDAIHMQTRADIVRAEKYDECIPLMKPDDPIGSAMNSIQIVLNELMKKIDSYLSAINSYVDALRKPVDIRKYIEDVSCQIAKYMKFLLDKIMEYTIKILNKALANVVAALPSNYRYLFSDIKEKASSAIFCLYSKMIDGLCGMISEILNGLLDIDSLEKNAKKGGDKTRKKPKVPMCYAETVVGKVIGSNKKQINDLNDNILNNISNFVDGVQNEIAGIDVSISDVMGQISSISGDLSSALNFDNIFLNILDCSAKMEQSVSDCYKFSVGSTSQQKSQLSSIKAIADNANKFVESIPSPPKIPFLEPTSGQENVNY